MISRAMGISGIPEPMISDGRTAIAAAILGSHVARGNHLT
jgi:hypothetical protein